MRKVCASKSPPAGEGSLRWRVRYRFAQRQQMLSLGVYPEVTLKQAREARDEIRQQLRNGIDPSAARKATQAAAAGVDTFDAIAREWHRRQSKTWSAAHADHVLRLMENDLFPWIGQRTLAIFSPPNCWPCCVALGVFKQTTLKSHRLKSHGT
ncbi:MAG TPA: Arm DNA-binding domain-containing protein, partial [Candidatus Competibacteraceae bacterium]|nr:Arm DNA-binding domain-containing protein [Candidatus Competibacteraceae bacterium]